MTRRGASPPAGDMRAAALRASRGRFPNPSARNRFPPRHSSTKPIWAREDPAKKPDRNQNKKVFYHEIS
ncbi:MAG: hypothetical protein J6W70_05860, partial [Lentisphaeria bacterium]|nr:hypothetical protein [Lentisphaeria bacterium]